MPTAPQTEESIFAEALDLPSPEARAAFLESACAGDAALRARIERLLKSHTGAGSFLQKPVPLTTAETLPERPGTIIGAYKLLQQIGEGGMGVVYMAEQEQPVRRRVALKIIKPGMDSRQVIARFEAERQALAMMDHQNIAKVLDAGTTDSGRPFFVMELVHGVPITKFCDDNRLTLKQRLELFVPVCQAIQHAHQKGVIHRDIKPTNILVTMYDDKPVPKVIDFGVAKAVEQRLTERTLFTQYGMLVGTFEYMSPEQAEMNAFGVDTRSDVYSLGVLLYELLTGTTPIERNRLRDAAFVELVRVIKEEEPPRPSIRLSTSGALPKIAAACRMHPAQLSKLVRGELDWIVMKCLEKDRTRRYETVNGLARDVQRYLKDEPVEACPPSPLYRLKKLAKKHRGLLTTAASFLALLVIGVVVSSLLAAWALRSQRIAESALAQAEQSLAREQQARKAEEVERRRAESASERLKTATQITSEGMQSLRRGNWAAAHEQFNKAAELEPDLRSIYDNRSCLYTTLGLWDRAAEDYDRVFRLASRASTQTCYEHALLRYYVGDETGYRQACEELLRQHGKTRMRLDQQFLMRARLLAPQPVGDPEALARRAEEMVADNYVAWNLGLAGRAHLRAGHLDKAVARARGAINLTGNLRVLSYLTLAMALHRLDQKTEAQDALTQAESAMDGIITTMETRGVGAMPVDWTLWLTYQIDHREAKRLIGGSDPPDDPRLAMIRDRALATITQGDASTHHEAGRKFVQDQLWDAAAASYAQVLDHFPEALSGATLEMRMCLEMVRHEEVFDRLVKLRPRSGHPWQARGRIYADAGEWTKASGDYEQAVARVRAAGSRRILQLELAALYLLAGNEVAYRDLCSDMINEQAITNATIAQVIARACSLRGGAVSDADATIGVGTSAVAASAPSAWEYFALGAAQHRAGQHANAIETLQKSLEANPEWIGRGQNFLYLAMACHDLNRDAEARDWLAKAEVSMQELQRLKEKWGGFANCGYMSDWLSALVLLPEAKAMLAGSENGATALH
jgi:serine/threonine protein kinase